MKRQTAIDAATRQVLYHRQAYEQLLSRHAPELPLRRAKVNLLQSEAALVRVCVETYQAQDVSEMRAG